MVDGICYEGAPRAFNFKTFDDVTLVTGIELLKQGHEEWDAPTLDQHDSVEMEAVWALADTTLRVSR
jgi:hypothetical protein